MGRPLEEAGTLSEQIKRAITPGGEGTRWGEGARGLFSGAEDGRRRVNLGGGNWVESDERSVEGIARVERAFGPEGTRRAEIRTGGGGLGMGGAERGGRDKLERAIMRPVERLRNEADTFQTLAGRYRAAGYDRDAVYYDNMAARRTREADKRMDKAAESLAALYINDAGVAEAAARGMADERRADRTFRDNLLKDEVKRHREVMGRARSRLTDAVAGYFDKDGERVTPIGENDTDVLNKTLRASLTDAQVPAAFVNSFSIRPVGGNVVEFSNPDNPDDVYEGTPIEVFDAIYGYYTEQMYGRRGGGMR